MSDMQNETSYAEYENRPLSLGSVALLTDDFGMFWALGRWASPKPARRHAERRQKPLSIRIPGGGHGIHQRLGD